MAPALSVTQPWAWLIAAGHKDIENRTWRPALQFHGQRIVIHASRKFTQDDYEDAVYVSARVEQQTRRSIHIPDPAALVCGAAIGTAVLRRSVEYSHSPWMLGPYGWEFTDAELWEQPVPFRGALGIWNFPDELMPVQPPSMRAMQPGVCRCGNRCGGPKSAEGGLSAEGADLRRERNCHD